MEHWKAFWTHSIKLKYSFTCMYLHNEHIMTFYIEIDIFYGKTLIVQHLVLVILPKIQHFDNTTFFCMTKCVLVKKENITCSTRHGWYDSSDCLTTPIHVTCSTSMCNCDKQGMKTIIDVEVLYPTFSYTFYDQLFTN